MPSCPAKSMNARIDFPCTPTTRPTATHWALPSS